MTYWQTPLRFDPLTDRITDTKDRPVATVFVGVQHSDEQVAMGYKLAAAPELLEALQEVKAQVTFTEFEDELWDRIDSAIAKATGEQP